MPKGEHEADLMYVLCVMELHNTEREHVGTLKYLRDKCIKCLEKLDPMVFTEIERIMSSVHNLIRFYENIEKSMQEISEDDNQQSLVGRILLIHLTDGGGACIPSECFRILDNRDRLLSLVEANEITLEFSEDDSPIKLIHSDSILKEFDCRVISRINNYHVMVEEISRYTGDGENLSQILDLALKSIDPSKISAIGHERSEQHAKKYSQPSQNMVTGDNEDSEDSGLRAQSFLMDFMFTTVLNPTYMSPFLQNAQQQYQQWLDKTQKQDISSMDYGDRERFLNQKRVLDELTSEYKKDKLDRDKIFLSFHKLKDLGDPPSEMIPNMKGFDEMLKMGNVDGLADPIDTDGIMSMLQVEDPENCSIM